MPRAPQLRISPCRPIDREGARGHRGDGHHRELSRLDAWCSHETPSFSTTFGTPSKVSRLGRIFGRLLPRVIGEMCRGFVSRHHPLPGLGRDIATHRWFRRPELARHVTHTRPESGDRLRLGQSPKAMCSTASRRGPVQGRETLSHACSRYLREAVHIGGVATIFSCASQS